MFTKLPFNLKYLITKCISYIFTLQMLHIIHLNPRVYVNYYLYNILKFTTHCKIMGIKFLSQNLKLVHDKL